MVTRKSVLILTLFICMMAGCTNNHDVRTKKAVTDENSMQAARNEIKHKTAADFEYPEGWPKLVITCDQEELQWLMGDANYTGRAGGQVGNSYFGMNEEHVSVLPVNVVKSAATIEFAADEVPGLNKPNYYLQILSPENAYTTYPLQQNSMTVPKETGEYVLILQVDWGNGDNNINYWFKLSVRNE